ncbi:MAG: Chemotaxis protein CheA [Deltaproteobacteria bacterium]|jgi:two-component system chemotaxis sensor kinase CheA|nr:Chemotaxis protein CheA [Deltaproteobacteria bacterium]
MVDPALEEFVEEVEEILQDLEQGILLLENQPRKKSLIDRIFRNMHTIKGGAGMVMQTDLADYAHHFENLLDKVRSGEIICTPEMATLLLDSLDGLNSFMDKIRGTGDVNQQLIERTLKQIGGFESTVSTVTSDSVEEKIVQTPEKEEKSTVESAATEDAEPSQSQVQDAWDDEDEDEKGYLLNLKFSTEMLRNGSDPLLLIRELKTLGDLTMFPHLSSLPELKNLDTEELHLWWSAKLVTARSPEELENILIFYQGDDHDVNFEPVEPPPEDPGLASTGLVSKKQITQILVGDVPEPQIEAEESTVSSEEKNEEKPLTEEVQKTEAKPKTEEVQKTQAETEPQKKSAPKPQLKEPEVQTVQSIRVAVEKLDKLQNMVGETVINQSRLHQLSDQIMGVDENMGEMLAQFVEDNEKSVRELQDQILQVRMIPVGSIFTPMRRTVRDFANRNNKKIRLEIEGGDTELDKTVTEQLHGPLVHLVRNSMDHGIEDPETRKKNSKDPTGTILLKASQQEGYVIVEIEDDGGGIDSKEVFESAVNKELISPSEELTEHEIFQLLFLPGFTTTTEVSDVSGRGVGMDSVKKDIEALLGTIEISSTPGKGTNVKLKLPLTLAIIEGMMIYVGNQVFTVPLLSVNEAIRPLPKQIKKIKRKGELVEIRGEYIPLLRLHERLSLKPRFKEPTEGLVLVVQHANRKQCLLVDEIVDQRPVVIKSLEDNFIHVPGIAGATILGDGSVSFILDVPSLVN